MASHNRNQRMRESFRAKIAICGTALISVACLTGAATAPPSPDISKPPTTETYRDYFGPTIQLPAATKATPANLVEPIRGAMNSAPLPSGARNASPANAPKDTPTAAAADGRSGTPLPLGTIPHPTVVRATASDSSGGLTPAKAAATTTTTCNYYPTSTAGSPQPPVTSDGLGSFAVATSWYTSGWETFNQGFSRIAGTGNQTKTMYAWEDVSLDLALRGFPSGSSAAFFINPLWRGRTVTSSNTSLTYNQSSATAVYQFWTALGRDGNLAWDRWWDVQDTNNSGVSQAQSHYWNGLPSGTAYVRSISITGDSTYTFRVSTRTSAIASAIYLAGASSQVDYGSKYLDTPAGINPYNGGTMINGDTTTGEAVPYVTVQYSTPGLKVIC